MAGVLLVAAPGRTSEGGTRGGGTRPRVPVPGTTWVPPRDPVPEGVSRGQSGYQVGYHLKMTSHQGKLSRRPWWYRWYPGLKTGYLRVPPPRPGTRPEVAGPTRVWERRPKRTGTVRRMDEEQTAGDFQPVGEAVSLDDALAAEAEPDLPPAPNIALIPPGPVPVNFAVGTLPPAADGECGVQLTVSDPTGVKFYFLTRQLARKMASDIRKASEGAPLVVAQKPGLIVPGR